MIQRIPLNALRRTCVTLDGSAVDWVVTGSLGFALHGIETRVHDIDIQTDRQGAYEIEKRFRQYVTRPVRFWEAGCIRSHFGALEIDGIEVEIIGDIQKRLPNGTWEPAVDVRKRREFVEVDGLQVPVLSVAYEAQAYATLGRTEKANQLRRWLITHQEQRLGEPSPPAD